MFRISNHELTSQALLMYVEMLKAIVTRFSEVEAHAGKSKLSELSVIHTNCSTHASCSWGQDR
jgi:hypothetical protein